MAVSRAERDRLARMKLPPATATRQRINEYLALTGMGAAEFGAAVGYSLETVKKFLAGSYSGIASTDVHFRAAAEEFMSAHPVREEFVSRGQLFVTGNYRRIRRYFLAAVERNEVCLLYGPPGTQKTFAVEHLIAERNRAQKRDACYVYATIGIRPRALLRRIARATRAVASFATNDHLIEALVRHLRAHPGAIVVDEAQHLSTDALEALRELHDRAGCGLLLAGSHTLYDNFLRGREQLEQWLSRIDHKEPLPGLSADEAARIAVRELGNGRPAELSRSQIRDIVQECRVDDIFARDPKTGRNVVRKYLSVRRLVKVLAQLKAGDPAAGDQEAV